jgi:hypothetical protein
MLRKLPFDPCFEGCPSGEMVFAVLVAGEGVSSEALSGCFDQFASGVDHLAYLRGGCPSELFKVRKVAITIAGPLSDGVSHDSAVVVGDGPQIVEQATASFFVH